MAEWFKAHAWNACVRESVPRVRIPLLPPVLVTKHLLLFKINPASRHGQLLSANHRAASLVLFLRGRAPPFCILGLSRLRLPWVGGNTKQEAEVGAKNMEESTSLHSRY
jgi:hypothetical protein